MDISAGPLWFDWKGQMAHRRTFNLGKTPPGSFLFRENCVHVAPLIQDADNDLNPGGAIGYAPSVQSHRQKRSYFDRGCAPW